MNAAAASPIASKGGKNLFRSAIIPPDSFNRFSAARHVFPQLVGPETLYYPACALQLDIPPDIINFTRAIRTSVAVAIHLDIYFQVSRFIHQSQVQPPVKNRQLRPRVKPPRS
jgi:hypothetical protein